MSTNKLMIMRGLEGLADTRELGCAIQGLESSDFFTAPASTIHHGSYEGGLAEHTVHVCQQIMKLKPEQYGIDRDSALLSAIFHDVCKIGMYKIEWKNGKWTDEGEWDDNAPWSRKEVWGYTQDQMIGHGEASVIWCLQHEVALNEDELLAINWHMGPFDHRFQDIGARKQYNQAAKKYPLVTLLHVADLMASRTLDYIREA